jgi:hypothetical protein
VARTSCPVRTVAGPSIKRANELACQLVVVLGRLCQRDLDVALRPAIIPSDDGNPEF